MSALLSATSQKDVKEVAGAKRFYIIIAGSCMMIALCIAAYYLLIAGDSSERICPLYRLSGVPCPSCGGSRAFAALFKGEISASLSLNPNALLATLSAASVVGVLIHDFFAISVPKLHFRLLLWDMYLFLCNPRFWKPSTKSLIVVLMCVGVMFEAYVWWHNIRVHI